MKRIFSKTTSVFLFFLFLMGNIKSYAQQAEPQVLIKRSVVIKASFLAPYVGLSFPVGETGSLRATTSFFTSFDEDTELLLNLSYLRHRMHAWGTHYFGIEMGTHISAYFTLIPGLMTGMETQINERVSIFGEIGLAAIINTYEGETNVGLFNSGVGIQWNF